jgi:hypothetical protein
MPAEDAQFSRATRLDLTGIAPAAKGTNVSTLESILAGSVALWSIVTWTPPQTNASPVVG